MKRKRQNVLHRFIPLLLCSLSCASAIYAGEDADFRKAQSYYTLQEYQLAADAFKAYLAANGKSERADQAALLLAESHFQLKQYNEAAAAYDTFVATYPESARRPDALLRAVRVHFLKKDYAKSLAAAETFLKENRPKLNKPEPHPQLPTQVATAIYYSGECQFSLKNTAAAQASWEDLIKTYPDSKLVPDASEGLGWIYFDKGQFDAALERFRITANTPQHPRAGWAALMQGRCFAALGKNSEALTAFKTAPTLTPADAKDLEREGALRTGETLMAAKDIPAALTAFTTLTKLAPDYPPTLSAIGTATYQAWDTKHYKETIQFADLYLALKNGPDRAALLRVKSRSALALNNQAEAAEIAKQAVTEAAALTNPDKKPEEHSAALVLLAELSGKGGKAFYETCAKLYPATRYGLAARYELARLAANENQTDEALTHVVALLEALKTAPADPNSASLKNDALFAAAEFSFRKADYAKAEAYIKEYSATVQGADPRGDDVARKLAWIRSEQKDFAGAAKVLDEALAKFPTSAYRDEMLYLRSSAAFKLNNEPDALKASAELLKSFPKSSFADDARYERGVALFKKDAVEEAIAELTPLIDDPAFEKSPLRSAALQLRAAAFLKQGKAAEAAKDADAALKIAPEKSAALDLLRALALSAQTGKEAEAIAALEKVAKDSPTAPEAKQATWRRAYLHFATKDYAKAKEAFTAYLAMDPEAGIERLEAEIRLAACLRELKETAEARKLLERLAANNPQQNRFGFEINSQLGNLLFEAKDFEAAQTHYAVAAASAAKTPPAEIPAAARAANAVNLAWSLRYLKKNEPAAAAFADVIALDRDGNYAAEALLERGRILEELGKADEAIAAWTALLTTKPDAEQSKRALLLRAQRQAKLAKFPEAATDFELFIKKYPTDKSTREAWSGLAECNMQTKNAASAEAAFLKVLGEKGLEADLDEPAERAILGLAEVNLRKGDALNAKKLALRVLTEVPGSTWADAALFTAGQASETLGEPERAIGYYRKLIADHPQSAQINAAKDRLKALGAAK